MFKVGDIIICNRQDLRKVEKVSNCKIEVSYPDMGRNYTNIISFDHISRLEMKICPKFNRLNRKLYPNYTEKDGYLIPNVVDQK